jgi:Flp pilus assembly protein TadG
MEPIRLGLVSGRRANALIEFLLMLPFYATLLFGAMEFSQLFYDRVHLNNACREGARAAATGKTLADIQTLTQNAELVGNLSVPNGQTITVTTSSDSGTTWTAATDNGSANAIRTGDLCRVQITGWRHRMVTGAFFNWFPNVSAGYMTMSGSEIMMRE